MKTRRINRKLISLILVLCLLLSIVLASAYADGDLEATQIEPTHIEATITVVEAQPIQADPKPTQVQDEKLQNEPESGSSDVPEAIPVDENTSDSTAASETEQPAPEVETGDQAEYPVEETVLDEAEEEENSIQATISRDGFVYVMTRRKQVRLYTGKNLSQVAGTIRRRDSLLFATRYVERGGGTDAVRVAFSDGSSVLVGYVSAGDLQSNVVDTRTANEWLSGSAFYAGNRPVAVIEYDSAGSNASPEQEDDGEVEEELEVGDEVDVNEPADDGNTDEVSGIIEEDVENVEGEEETEVGEELVEEPAEPEITEAAQAIIDRIDALPEDLLSDVSSALTKLYSIRRAYFALSRSERAMVGNLQRLDELWSSARGSMPSDARALADLIEWISETQDMVMVTEAYALYDAMGTENLAYVYNLAVLLRLAGDVQDDVPTEDTDEESDEPAIPEAVQAIIDRIAALREHQLNDVPTALSILYSIRQAYFALNNDERTMVGNITRLDELWSVFRSSMPADARALADMIERVADTHDASSVAEAYAAYESMSALSREFVYNLDILLGMSAPDDSNDEVPEEEVEEPTVSEAAQAVIEMINALPDDLLSDVPAALSQLYSIRRAYFALSRPDRAMVSNADALEALWSSARAAMPEDARMLADMIEWISETQDLEKIPDALTAYEFTSEVSLAYVYNLSILLGLLDVTMAGLIELDLQEEAIEPMIKLSVQIEGEVLTEGTPVTIMADIEGLPDGAIYDTQWQNDLNGEFEDVPGETGMQVTFNANEQNVSCAWRLQLTLFDMVEAV